MQRMSPFSSSGEQTRVSRACTAILRHRAEGLGITMSSDGFVKVSDLISHLNRHGFNHNPLSVEQIQYVVESCPKQRFSLKQTDDVLYIRANQGHSVKSVDAEAAMHRVTADDLSSLEVCVHGTRYDLLPAIWRTGLSKMARQHVHISTSDFGDKKMISGLWEHTETHMIHCVLYRHATKFFASDLHQRASGCRRWHSVLLV